MIVRLAGDLTLIDCEALAVQTKRPIATIRKHCQPLASDIATRRQLYDADACAALLAKVGRRAAHRKRRSLTKRGL